MRLDIFIPSAIALAVIWSGVAVVMRATDDEISSPEKIAQIVSERPWLHGKKPSPAERKVYLDRLAKYYTMLDNEQRRTMRDEDSSGEMMAFLAELHEDERKNYLSVIIEAQVRPLMKAWSLVSKDERQKMLGGSRAALKRRAGGSAALQDLTEADNQVFQKLIEGNLDDYYKNSTDAQKLNLAPLFEDLQTRLNSRR